MYASILAKIKATLDSVPLVKESFSTPKTKLDKFPAVFFKPESLDNNYLTNTENAKVYRFMIMVLVGATNQTVGNAFGEILPKVVDQIVAAFDEQWDQGVIDNHRVWCRLYSPNAWEVSEEQDGLMAYAPLLLEVKTTTDV